MHHDSTVYNIYHSLRKHLNELLSTKSLLSLNNQLDVNQSGFKKGHSTKTAFLSVTEALQIQKLLPNHQFSFSLICLHSTL